MNYLLTGDALQTLWNRLRIERAKVAEPPEFVEASTLAESCLGFARAVSSAVEAGRDDTELRAKLRTQYEQMEPKLRPYIEGTIKHSEGEVNIGWPYRWRSAHEAAPFVCYMVMLETPPLGEWVTRAEAARRLGISSTEIGNRIDAGELRDNGASGRLRKVFLPSDVKRT